MACYVETLTEKEKLLLMEVAPFVSVGHNADDFLEELDRLVESYPAEVNLILGKVLEVYRPTYDYEDRLKNLLIKLSERGKKEDALVYADRLRNLPGFIQLFKRISSGGQGRD